MDFNTWITILGTIASVAALLITTVPTKVNINNQGGVLNNSFNEVNDNIVINNQPTYHKTIIINRPKNHSNRTNEAIVWAIIFIVGIIIAAYWYAVYRERIIIFIFVLLILGQVVSFMVLRNKQNKLNSTNQRLILGCWLPLFILIIFFGFHPFFNSPKLELLVKFFKSTTLNTIEKSINPLWDFYGKEVTFLCLQGIGALIIIAMALLNFWNIWRLVKKVPKLEPFIFVGYILLYVLAFSAISGLFLKCQK